VLLPPAAAAAVNKRMRQRVVSHCDVTFGPHTITVSRLRLPRSPL
jgi:hypothetical protein